jgi:alanyl-tRNA synthetase
MGAPISSDEIRERYLAFFEQRGHRRIPSASLVPSAHDPSALLTVAGMHPLKPYFLGQERPPAPRLTDCQKCFRTVDIEQVGNTNRHLTFFEMLGNFSIGDYFKREAIAFAWELSLEVFGFEPQDIWVTVFEGDEQLGLGPDEEAIGFWEEVGVPGERIVPCPRSENFWQVGPTGPCGPCSELYLDRGEHLGKPDDLPGGENERFLEYWNLVFMQYLQEPENVLSPLPAANIDTGLGLNRLAAILQQTRSVFETDQFKPLIELGESLSGQRYGERFETDRPLRILADHARAMSFLIADGVVPSNEDRGYVLRRVMRRAILQGRTLQLEPGFLLRYAHVVRETMASAYPELAEQRAAIERWLAAEEESFGRTLQQGLDMLRFHVDRARDHGQHAVAAEDAFKLHDTFGFPFELTTELLEQEGLGVDSAGFESLMDAQRRRARAAAASGPGAGTQAADLREQALTLARSVEAPTRFTGYETERQTARVGAVAVVGQPDGDPGRPQAADGRHTLLVKLDESPFYAVGGGQVSDAGTIECERGDCKAEVERVLRLGEDQVIEVRMTRGSLAADTAVVAHVDHQARHATQCNHTATHLLHAALRARLGDHVRQAGSYVGPDKLRFDFTHSAALSEQELADVEDQVNAWIARNDPVKAILTTLEEARRLGAMALFGEKYGEVVRMVEIADGQYSRELCGGTHVRSTAEIGPFHVLSETSSAANVRRVEAITGPAAVALLRQRNQLLGQAARQLRTQPEQVPQLLGEHERERRALLKAQREGGGRADGSELEGLLAAAEQIDGAKVLTAAVQAADAKALLGMLDRVKARLPEAAIVLGSAAQGRVHLIASVPPPLVQRGVKAGAIVKAAASVAGGGGGGRDTMAQAGGRDPQALPEAIAVARRTIASALGVSAGEARAEPEDASGSVSGGAAEGN